MKILAIANQKGGVGKSAIAVQFAYFLTAILFKRVLVIDFDHQRNTTWSIRTGGLATVSAITSSTILKSKTSGIEHADFVLVPGDQELMKMEEKAAELTAFVKYAKDQGQPGARDGRSVYATNLYTFLASVADQFDVCIIDTNPNPDIRQLAALVVSDFVLSPLQLNQEAINGIGDLLNHPNIGIRNIQATINKKLQLIGILPNLVEPTPFQRDNMLDLSKHYSKLFIPMAPLPGFASIKKTTAIAESQAAGVPVWKLGKTSGREAWTQIRPIFEKIADTMGVKYDND